ncbi:hypothetical protein ES705_12812 [subsurface metagenome]
MSNSFSISNSPQIAASESSIKAYISDTLDLSFVSPSDDVLHSNGAMQGHFGDVYFKVKESLCGYSGFIRVSFQIRTTGAGTCYGKVYVNDAARGIERSTPANGWVEFTEDFSVSANDLIQIWVKHSASNQNTIASSLFLKGVLLRNFVAII